VEYILFAAIFLGVCAMGPLLLNADGDLPRHLLVGKLIRTTYEIPKTDIFSFRTTGYPSTPHEWLAQVIFSTANDLLGLNGVVLLTAIIISIVWAVIFYEAFLRSGSLFISLAFTGLGMMASLLHTLPRPHIFTYLFLAVWAVVLEQVQRKPKMWWILPITMLVWVNLHGMFVLGIAIWGIYFIAGSLEEPIRIWFTNSKTKFMLLGGASSLLATFFSPSGPRIWLAIASLSGDAYVKAHISEYQSANFQIPETWPFILILLLLSASFARTSSRTSWKDTVLIVAFTALALYSSRMLPIFAIVAAPIAAKAFSDWLSEELPGNAILKVEANIAPISQSSNGFIWLILLVAAVTLLLQAGIHIDVKDRGNGFDPTFFPVQAVDWLQSHPQGGHVFNEFDWGGYLLLRLWPQMQIFMDGHTHIYGEALTKEYAQVITVGDGWDQILDQYQVQWAIVRTESPIAKALQERDWKILYQDKTAIILRIPAN
jgi:hypothetical protein